MNHFTEKDIKNLKAYEKVRQSGRFNMVDPRAAQASGLSSEDYSFVMKNFKALLKAAAEKPTPQGTAL